MMLTVAICTWNRAESLRVTLDSLARAAPPSRTPWELVVIDNNSTDHTQEVTRQFAERLPIRTVLEPRAGVSNARNAAVREARGEFLLWTDDDVLVDADWMRAYERAMDRHPSAVYFGGPATPVFLENPPAWLLRHWRAIGEVYAYRDLGERETLLTASEPPFGLNFAMRAEFMRRHPFDPHVGRNHGKRVLQGDEMVVLDAAARVGAEGYWVPDARIEHRIPPQRQTLSYVYRYYEGHGYSDTMSCPTHGHASTGHAYPLWAFRMAATEIARCLGWRVLSRDHRWLTHLRLASYRTGQARAIFDRKGAR